MLWRLQTRGYHRLCHCLDDNLNMKKHKSEYPDYLYIYIECKSKFLSNVLHCRCHCHKLCRICYRDCAFVHLQQAFDQWHFQIVQPANGPLNDIVGSLLLPPLNHSIAFWGQPQGSKIGRDLSWGFSSGQWGHLSYIFMADRILFSTESVYL